MRTRLKSALACALLSCGALTAQLTGSVSIRIATSPGQKGQGAVPVVVWLQPVSGDIPFRPHGKYTLLQKNRTFIPHLQVVPVGSSVQFPNVDPFFHNVFSLFDGRRFDLGLYEAGSAKSVDFYREGVSYIFCNIHPEMSAVVLALSTPLYSIAKTGQETEISGVLPGDYLLHIWVEGVPESTLNTMTRTVKVGTSRESLGEVVVTTQAKPGEHLNKFGDPYPPTPHTSY